MDFKCKCYVIDAVCGAGKTSAVINIIKQSDNDQKFLYITPFLDEVKRIKDSCRSKHFKSPKFENGGTKLDNIKKLFANGDNIVTTHALFQKFDNETIEIIKLNSYTLVMDEVAQVVDDFPITQYDYDNLTNTYVDIKDDTKQLVWRKEYEDYKGEFDNYKRLCELGSLVHYGGEKKLMVWLFPIKCFNAFTNIYILTYMFKSQLQSWYYDYYGLPYEFLSVDGNSLDTYHLIPYEKDKNYIKYDYSKLIHILDNEKLNRIGEDDYSLGSSWYERNAGSSIIMKSLKNNIYNYFKNIVHGNSKDNIWTTFKDYKSKLKGEGYSKGFIPVNSRATNEYKDRFNIAYPVNRFLNPYVKNFFTSNNIEINENGWALSEMLQFIWRSAIRDGKEINVYIPSKRMRNLLKAWIEENKLN